jgi:holo-[acyl-carrier protein] synthase
MAVNLHLAVSPVAGMPAPDDAIWRSRLDRAELAYCAGRRRAAEHLAVRVLARRAVAAALAWPGDPPWREITIRREPSGRPSVLLSSALTAWRFRHGLAVPGVSLSHAGGQAAALAWLPEETGMSECTERSEGRERMPKGDPA